MKPRSKAQRLRDTKAFLKSEARRRKKIEEEELLTLEERRQLIRDEARVQAKNVTRAAELKAHSTVSEQILIDELDRRGLAYRFQHLIGFWIVDFFFPRWGLVVEVDGGYHDEDSQAMKDLHRQADICWRGYRVIRFKNKEVGLSPSSVVDRIVAAGTDSSVGP